MSIKLEDAIKWARGQAAIWAGRPADHEPARTYMTENYTELANAAEAHHQATKPQWSVTTWPMPNNDPCYLALKYESLEAAQTAVRLALEHGDYKAEIVNPKCKRRYYHGEDS